APHLVHRLADADLGRLVEDRVDPFERAPDGGRIAYVALDELHVRVQVDRLALLMHLWDERVEHAYAVAALEERVDEVRPDEPRAARDQNAVASHRASPLDRRRTCVVHRATLRDRGEHALEDSEDARRMDPRRKARFD